MVLETFEVSGHLSMELKAGPMHKNELFLDSKSAKSWSCSLALSGVLAFYKHVFCDLGHAAFLLNSNQVEGWRAVADLGCLARRGCDAVEVVASDAAICEACLPGGQDLIESLQCLSSILGELWLNASLIEVKAVAACHFKVARFLGANF